MLLPIFFLTAIFAGSVFAGDKFVPLFDGKTLKGWTVCNGQATYKVEKGVLVGTTAEGSPNSFLCTDKEYGDFVLELEVLDDPVLNSGIQIRSHRYKAETKVFTDNGNGILERMQPAGRVHGYQVEIADAKSGASGGIYDEGRRGWLHNIASDPVASKAFRDNQWNKYRVEAIGDHIRTWINGVACADLVDSSDLTGFIALQVHQFKGEKPAQVRFRNLRIQDKGRHEWKPLFDGKTMTGWSQKGPGKWTIEDGALHGVSAPNETAPGVMISDRSISDATVRVFYKLNEKGESNSGFFVRANKENLAGYEVEIDEKKGSGGMWEVGGRKWVDGPKDNKAQRANDWNELVASVHGDRIVFHLNGIKTFEALHDTQGKKEGQIALQVHNKRVTDIQFKDVQILEPVK